LTAGDDDHLSPPSFGAKEADRINLGPWPQNVASYRHWRLSVVDEVVAASARPDAAFNWIAAVNSATDADLSDANFPQVAGRRRAGFETLDAKLSAALTKILSGEFARKVHGMKMKAMTDSRRLSGRQLLKAIDEHFKLTEADGAAFDMEHLLNVTMKNDSLEKFMDD